MRRPCKIEIYDGTSLDKTGTGSETWATLLFQKYRADTANNTEDGTGGQGMAFGPNYGLPNLYVMKGVNTQTSGVYEGRFHIYDLSSPTLEDTAYVSGQGQRDSGTMILGPDVNGDGHADLWSIDNRSHRINAYDPTTGDRVVTGIPIVDEQDVPCPTNGFRFPTNIAHGPGGSILVTTRFRTWLDPSWANAEAAGGNLVQLVWDKANLRAVATLKYELPNDTGRLDGVAYLGADLTVARDPSPSNGGADVIRDTSLSWTSGQYAATHDVYFGTSSVDVGAASRADPLNVLASQDQTTTTFDPPGLLAFGQTYYWRVDEVNAPPASTVIKGSVWSFTVEPEGYPVTPASATASSVMKDTMGPENTIDGSGLTGDRHSTDTNDMWISSDTASDPAWILYRFDKVYKLHEMWVWNSNQATELALGYGAREVVIEVSTDGSTWTALGGVPEFAQASGDPTYVYNTTVDFGGVLARYVSLTIKANWSEGIFKACSLSEVRFFTIPVWASMPQPASGATNVAVDGMLGWKAGREAASHEVYLSTDSSAGTAPVKTVTESQVSLTSLGVEYDRTYYWKVNEVNEAATPTSWAGDVWSFSTLGYVVIDGFEAYNDKCGRVYYVWKSGASNEAKPECGVSAYSGNGTGSLVGNDPPGPYAERTVVHGGLQSMPFFYDNTAGYTVSEATRTFDAAQDWTLGGIKTLVLYFCGEPTNGVGQLYVKINNTKVAYDGSANAIAMGLWKQWNIDLASMAGLQAVQSLTIGVSGAVKGKLYIDDIRLYRIAPAVPVPVDPGTTGLAAYYTFESDVKDGSGHGYDGAAVNDPTYGDSQTGLGKGLLFDGVNDYVDLPIGTLVSTLTNATVATWVSFDNSGTTGWERIFDLGTGTTNYMYLAPRQATTGPMTFGIRTAAVAEKRFAGSVPLRRGWHHVAVVIDGVGMTATVYLDGDAVATGTTTVLPKDLGVTNQNWLGRSQWPADGYFAGALDEFRVYDRGLAVAEVRYLAGDR